MSDKFGIAEGEGLPEYEESTTSPRELLSGCKDSLRPSLHAQLAETRTRRINHLLTTYIEPEIYSHFLDGIYKRAFLLVPSDVLTHQHNLEAKDIVGLPDSGNVSVVRLVGDENRAAFWQQAGVLQELASSLRARLAASGHRVEASGNAPGAHSVEQAPLDRPQRRTQPSWLKKQFGTPGPEHDPTATTNYRLGWRAENGDGARTKVGPDEVRVGVKVRDVSFRVETDMGLLDSVTGKILWLELEVGT